MAAKEDLKLFGLFSSPFVYRVIWALKLMRLEFEYIEEDIFSKSDLLLKHNPIHKKVPALIHGGRPIAESVVILEYIEEMWPGVYPLLPSDPYERAQARFWVKFGEDKMRAFVSIFTTTSDEQTKDVVEAREALPILENEGLGEKKYFGGDKVRMADLEFGWLTFWLQVIEDVSGFKVVSEWLADFPCLKEWFEEFKKLETVRENAPDQKRLFAYFKHLRELYISPKSSLVRRECVLR